MKTTITLIKLLYSFYIFSSIGLSAQSNEYNVLINFQGNGDCNTSSCANGSTFELVTNTGLLSYSFNDPVSANDIAKSITVKYFGDCTATMQLSLNGYVIGTDTVGGSCECFCETGADYSISSPIFPGGIPGYIVGGNNILNIDITDLSFNGTLRQFYAEVIINDSTLLSTAEEEIETSEISLSLIHI